METKKLKLGIVCYPTYGGSGVIATEIGMAMARRGHNVHFISSDLPRRLDRYMENIYFHEVEARDYPLFMAPSYAIGLASKIVEVASHESLDLVHVHYAVPHATSAFLAKQVLGEKAPKVVTTLHGTDITLVGTDRGYLPLTRFSIEQSDGVTTPSNYLRYATYDKLNVTSSTKIEVIPNFIDTVKFAPGDPKTVKPIPICPRSKEKILVHVSNFRPVKRILDVVKIFAEVSKQLPSRLVLIGDGPERSAAEQLIRELKLTSKVCLLGKLEDFVDVLQQSDIFLLPSESESFGLAALEAQSCGVPVVASNAGGIPEVIVDGGTGFLSSIGDVQAMAASCVKLLSDKPLWTAQSEAARTRAVDNFGLETTIDKYEDCYFRTLFG